MSHSIPLLRVQLFNIVEPFLKGADPAHGVQHFEAVFECGKVIRDRLGLDVSDQLLLTAAYLHDMYTAIDRPRHHELSHNYVLLYREHLVEMMGIGHKGFALANMCLQHRASFSGRFTSVESELFNAADFELPRGVQPVLERAVKYAQHHQPTLSKEGRLEVAVKHLKEKFGYGGYAKYPEMYRKVFAEELEQLQDEIALL